MKIILAALTILLSLNFVIGQTVANNTEDTDWVKLAQAFRQIWKDAESDFAAIRGKEGDESGGKTEYVVTKNRLQPWSFDAELTYFKDQGAYMLTFAPFLKDAIRLEEIVKNLFEKELANKIESLKIDSVGTEKFGSKEGGEFSVTFDSDPIASFFYGENNQINFASHPTAWKKINEYLAKKTDKELAELIARNNPAKTEKNSTTAQNSPSDLLNSVLKSVSDSRLDVTMLSSLISCEEGDKESCNKLIESATGKIKANPKDAYNFSFRGNGYLNSALILSEFLKPNKSDKTEKQAQADAKQAAEYTKLAQADFEKYLELEPDGVSARRGLGITQFFLDQEDSAITNLTKYIEKFSDNKTAYQFRSLTYYSLKKYQLAINDADKALELNKTKFRNETEKKEFADYMTFFRGKYAKELEKAQKGGK